MKPQNFRRHMPAAILIIIISALTAVLFENCSATKFTGATAVPSSSSAAAASGSLTGSNDGGATVVGGGTCALSNVSVPVKVLFVVDRSGSNAMESQDEGTEGCTSPSLSGCAPPTDPQKTFRGNSISTFFTQNQSNTLFSWGFLAFSGTSAKSYITSGNRASFGNEAAMQSAITQFSADSDQDATPYLAALSSAQTAIANDPDLNLTGTSAPLYEIIFLSDGYPTDALNSDGSVDTTSINNKITSIANLAPGRIFLSSVYYGTINDPTAASTLQNMATVGNGQFINADTSSTSSITIDNLISIPSGDCVQ